MLPIFSYIVYSSSATYFILVTRECDELFLYRRRHKEGVQLEKRGGGGPLPKRGGGGGPDPMDHHLLCAM